MWTWRTRSAPRKYWSRSLEIIGTDLNTRHWSRSESLYERTSPENLDVGNDVFTVTNEQRRYHSFY